ncbi:hypothetical protein GCM10010964_11490 [Caldovatus sediminis]|uniref:Glucose/Sorbosone dehydrogenase domain-containing protein n=1 Tax=Caldovatus sediminis TaxID=2041189 RepID=A0A8J2Z9N9_9PROT|nr:PQQ-dependent sugar dehydrogenase [Caldovatus sediminis]GGG25172.1 hypothetical protein GCM10010964_11490 [Caldovatus sediminis]
MTSSVSLLRSSLALALIAALAASCAQGPPSAPVRSDAATFRVTEFARGLEHPWGAVFLPDGSGDMLVTERPGRLRRVTADGRVSPPIPGVPEVAASGQGGLLDIALAPDFASSREIFFCHGSAVPEGGALTRLSRARLSADGTRLEGTATVLDAGPPQRLSWEHYGCRIAFSPDGRYLFFATGERKQSERAQRLDDLAGKVLRLARDGSVPPDNPFVGRADARPEIWSYGHRNPQGLAFNPWTGSLWEAELGPRGGDEVNVIRRGANYGWPVVSQGLAYSGFRFTEHRSLPGMEDPAYNWTPSVSPSGIAFYDGAEFPGWRGSLFLATLSPPQLVRLTTAGDRVTGEERLLQGLVRMRHVLVGPDGRLYILTDEPNGRILRLDPAR